MDVTKKRDSSKPANEQGVFHKFDVRRTDGSDKPGGKHHGCRYFVLDLDHDPHAAAAMAAYAQDCKVTHPALSAELSVEYPPNMVDAHPVNARLLEALKTLRDALRDHPEYAQLSEEQEEETGGDTAEFSYLVRVADEAIAAAEIGKAKINDLTPGD